MAESSSKWVENAVRKGEKLVASNFSFPSVFSKDLYCGHVNVRPCLGKR